MDSAATARPAEADRLFTSPAVEAAIAKISPTIVDATLRRMFEQCLPNTLDTTVHYQENADGQPDTYVATGDIPAMWLRDSTNQMWPYLQFIKQDEKLGKAFIGLINRQVTNISTDPYANAFTPDGDVWERKFELDSLASFLRLSGGYYAETSDASPFNDAWVTALNTVLAVITTEQASLTQATSGSLFKFTGPDGQPHPAVRLQGYGYPGQSTGLVRSVFRPSDDEAVFPYHIPANAMLVAGLQSIIPILKKTGQRPLAETVAAFAHTIDHAIHQHGIVHHAKLGPVYAYEVDGFGSTLIMDDPNAPSLLSLPYFGYKTRKDPPYQATRTLALSEANPFYASGTVAAGLTSPHTGMLDHFWPIATVMQALTSNTETEIRSCLDTLKNTHGGTHFIHESVGVNDANSFTRPWFAWGNSLFGELILHLAHHHPEVLSGKA